MKLIAQSRRSRVLERVLRLSNSSLIHHWIWVNPIEHAVRSSEARLNSHSARRFPCILRLRLQIHPAAAVLFQRRKFRSRRNEAEREAYRDGWVSNKKGVELLDARFLVSRSNVTDPIDSGATVETKSPSYRKRRAAKATVYSNRRRQAVPEIRSICARTCVHLCAGWSFFISLLFLLGSGVTRAPRKYITFECRIHYPTLPFARIYSFPSCSVLCLVAGSRNSLRAVTKETLSVK